MIYTTMLIGGAIISKSTHINTIHATLGFHKTEFKFILLAILFAVVIWLGDYYFQTTVMHTDMLHIAQQWHSQQSSMLMVFLSTAVLTPIIEEMLFRGILFEGLKAHLSAFWSALILSMIFAIIHFDFVQFIPLFFASMIYYFITQKSRSIIPAISAHLLNNVATFLYYSSLIKG